MARDLQAIDDGNNSDVINSNIDARDDDNSGNENVREFIRMLREMVLDCQAVYNIHNKDGLIRQLSTTFPEFNRQINSV